ncbi:spore germination protein GerW family protein [Nonomuraea sp. MCN248]|uniref:Spore germination protein GerW family protein n=1 Tax=Nonomuraea corallina TaxID=2989783 RepID=A0ABT4SGL1_9ACTN|nr:spore germination protein GerW family protein [Nonomuraea corallina]MDA0636135.1 spore germination protein GerW family protein [Nonomuraea corallina]
MDIVEIAEKSKDSAQVKRVFGDPVQHGDVVVIPVARIAYGGGGGGGQGEKEPVAKEPVAKEPVAKEPGAKEQGDKRRGESGSGGGLGYGVSATPAGVFVIKDGDVRWQPAVDVNRIVAGGQIVAVVLLLTLRAIMKRRRRRRH